MSYAYPPELRAAPIGPEEEVLQVTDPNDAVVDYNIIQEKELGDEYQYLDDWEDDYDDDDELWLPEDGSYEAAAANGPQTNQQVIVQAPGQVGQAGRAVQAAQGWYLPSDPAAQQYCQLHPVECQAGRPISARQIAAIGDPNNQTGSHEEEAQGLWASISGPKPMRMSGFGLVLIIGLLLFLGLHIGWDRSVTSTSSSGSGKDDKPDTETSTDDEKNTKGLREEVKKAKDKQKKADDELKEAKVQLSDTKKQLRETEQKIEGGGSEEDKAALASAKQDVERLRKERDEAKNKGQSGAGGDSEEVNRLKTQLADAKTKRHQLDAQLKEATNKVATSEEDKAALASVKQEAERLRKERDEAKNKGQSGAGGDSEEVNRLKTQLADAKTKKDQLDAQLRDAKAALRAKGDGNAPGGKDDTALQAEKGKVADLEEKLVKAGDRLTAKREDVDNLREELKQAKKKTGGSPSPPSGPGGGDPPGGLTKEEKQTMAKKTAAEQELEDAQKAYEAQKLKDGNQDTPEVQAARRRRNQAKEEAARQKRKAAKAELDAAEAKLKEEKAKATAAGKGEDTPEVKAARAKRDEAKAKYELAKAEEQRANGGAGDAPGRPPETGPGPRGPKGAGTDIDPTTESGSLLDLITNKKGLVPFVLLGLLLLVPLLGRNRGTGAVGYSPRAEVSHSNPYGARSGAAQVHINNVNAQLPEVVIPAAPPVVETVAQPVLHVVRQAVWEPLHFQLSGPADPDRLMRMLIAVVVALFPLLFDWMRGFPVRQSSRTAYHRPFVHWLIIGFAVLVGVWFIDQHSGLSATYGGTAMYVVEGVGAQLSDATVAAVQGGERAVWQAEDMLFGDGRDILGLVVAAIGVTALTQLGPPNEAADDSEYVDLPVQLMYILGVLAVGVLFFGF